MTTDERQFLSKVWFVFATFVAWNSFSLFYGGFDPSKKLSFPAVGDLLFTERCILGIPLLFVGYAVCYVLAVLIKRGGKHWNMEDVPDTGLTNRFMQTAFWFLMFLPVITIGWLYFGCLLRLTFEGGHDLRLSGWQLFELHSGKWYARGFGGGDGSHPSVWPFWTPLTYLLMTLAVIVSYIVLPWTGRRSAKRPRSKP